MELRERGSRRMEEGGGRVMTISEGKQGDEGMAGERRALDSQKSIIDESSA